MKFQEVVKYHEFLKFEEMFQDWCESPLGVIFVVLFGSCRELNCVEFLIFRELRLASGGFLNF